MTHRNLWLALLLPAIALATANVAAEIYKRVDEDGVVEYSDIPSAGADRIEVVPNVVETNPVKRSASADSAAETDNAAADDDTDADVADEESSSAVVADEDPGRATRNAVRAVSQPRPQPR